MSVKCGNRKAHGTDSVYHETPALVRACFQGVAYGKDSLPRVAGVGPIVTKAPVAVAGPATEGMHRLDGNIYKVQRAVHGSKHLYAKVLVKEEPDCGGCANGEPCGAGCAWKVSFEYAPGVIKRLSSATRMSLEEAKEFGALYGTCCVCGRTLTNEESIEAGIGPVCAGKGYWS